MSLDSREEENKLTRCSLRGHSCGHGGLLLLLLLKGQYTDVKSGSGISAGLSLNPHSLS